jgi:hypothetical protein
VGLALVDELDGATGRAADRCRALLEHWPGTDERRYAIPALRWAATLLASVGAEADLRLLAAPAGTPKAAPEVP